MLCGLVQYQISSPISQCFSWFTICVTSKVRSLTVGLFPVSPCLRVYLVLDCSMHVYVKNYVCLLLDYSPFSNYCLLCLRDYVTVLLCLYSCITSQQELSCSQIVFRVFLLILLRYCCTFRFIVFIHSLSSIVTIIIRIFITSLCNYFTVLHYSQVPFALGKG